MKRLGLFLLAVVMVAGLAGCHNSSSEPDPVTIKYTVTLSANCAQYPGASGYLQNISTGYATGTIVLYPGQSITLDLPAAGTYYVYFKTLFAWSFTWWEFNANVSDGGKTTLSCD